MHAAAGQGNSPNPIQELHPLELKEILERVSQGDADDVQLIDVREEFEHQTASLPGFKLMPMSRHGSQHASTSTAERLYTQLQAHAHEQAMVCLACLLALPDVPCDAFPCCPCSFHT